MLASYEDERKREWRMLLGVENQIQVSPTAPSWAGPIAGRLLSCVPASGDDLRVLLNQIGIDSVEEVLAGHTHADAL